MAFSSLKLFVALHILALELVHGQNDPGDHSNWIKELRKELFDIRQYDKHVRPVSHHSERTTVEMQFSFTRMIINEKDGTLETNGWLGLRWADDMMKWDPSSYGGLRSLKLNSDQLWKPDVVIYNSVRGYDTLPGSHIVVLSDGIIYYIPPLHLVTSCELDLTNWPFDTQTCFLRFGAWSHDSTEILLGILDNQTEADMKHYAPGESPWLITEAKAGVNSLQFDCCSPPYQDVVFTMQLKRRSPFDAKMALAPAVAVWILVLMTFWMRPQCPERIHIGCVSILIMVILLIYFRTALPPSGKSTPLVVIFYVFLLALCSISCAITLINSNLIRRTRPVPRWLIWIVRGRLFGCLLCNSSSNLVPDCERAMKTGDEPHSETETIIPSPVKIGVPLDSVEVRADRLRGKRAASDRQSWQLVAIFIDRLGFLLYLVLMTVMSLHYLLLQ